MGNHIEQTRTAYLDYPVGTIYQPNEHPLGMSRGHRPSRLAMRDFSIWPTSSNSEPDSQAQEKFKAHEKEQLDHMWHEPPQD